MSATAACHSSCRQELAECERTCAGGGQARRDCRTACAERSTGCAISQFFLDAITGTVLFASSCDPVGANPFGEQLFAMRPDGTGLRQLTNARGMTTDPDGTIHVELPGPFAYTSRAGG